PSGFPSMSLAPQRIDSAVPENGGRSILSAELDAHDILIRQHAARLSCRNALFVFSPQSHPSAELFRAKSRPQYQ
ncbi:MAG: hypothetical protein ACR2MF_03330, partial [Chthoniobacterales bacterium]